MSGKETIKKLNEKVELSGDLVTQMFNFIAQNGKYSEVVGFINVFNQEIEDQTEEVDIEEAKKEMEEARAKTEEKEDNE